MPVPAEAISAVLPLLVTAPLYVIGRRLWFKGRAQSEMHTIRSGQVFTLAVGLLHIALTVASYLFLFF